MKAIAGANKNDTRGTGTAGRPLQTTAPPTKLRLGVAFARSTLFVLRSSPNSSTHSSKSKALVWFCTYDWLAWTTLAYRRGFRMKSKGGCSCNARRPHASHASPSPRGQDSPTSPTRARSQRWASLMCDCMSQCHTAKYQELGPRRPWRCRRHPTSTVHLPGRRPGR